MAYQVISSSELSYIIYCMLSLHECFIVYHECVKLSIFIIQMLLSSVRINVGSYEVVVVLYCLLFGEFTHMCYCMWLP